MRLRSHFVKSLILCILILTFHILSVFSGSNTSFIIRLSIERLVMQSIFYPFLLSKSSDANRYIAEIDVYIRYAYFTFNRILRYS